MNLELFYNWAEEKGLPLNDEQKAQFLAFQTALYERNQVMNLTRIAPEECWRRHFIDSLLFQAQFPQGAKVLDLGTGPGFPAWPLACARPDLQITAVDSNGKMLGFLKTQLLPNLTVINARAEELGMREKFDCVTGRAIAPLPIQLELSAVPCRMGGAVLPFRTSAENFYGLDYSMLGLTQESICSDSLPGTDIIRVLPVFRKTARTARDFPRNWADIKAWPLSGLG